MYDNSDVTKFLSESLTLDITCDLKMSMWFKRVLEIQAYIALEILPLLLPVRNKKGVVGTKFLFFNVQDVVTSYNQQFNFSISIDLILLWGNYLLGSGVERSDQSTS